MEIKINEWNLQKKKIVKTESHDARMKRILCSPNRFCLRIVSALVTEVVFWLLIKNYNVSISRMRGIPI